MRATCQTLCRLAISARHWHGCAELAVEIDRARAIVLSVLARREAGLSRILDAVRAGGALTSGSRLAFAFTVPSGWTHLAVSLALAHSVIVERACRAWERSASLSWAIVADGAPLRLLHR